MPSRRVCIQAGLLAILGSAREGIARADAGMPLELAAAWDDAQGRHWIGVLRDTSDGASTLTIKSRLAVPTRAHALLPLEGGDLVAVSRRPGAWMLRWKPGSPEAHWHWSDAERSFNGHVVARGGALWSTETDVADGRGLWVQRDPWTLAVRETMQTGGIDPHALLPLSDGTWLIANGGVPTQPETGRTKRPLADMDSSLVRLDGVGRLLGRWRLSDARLSLRHLALHEDGTVGVALQAEHDDPEARRHAPLLAIWNGESLRTGENPSLGGYAGDILARPGGFVLGATRANCVVRYDLQGRFQRVDALAQACAVAPWGHEGWMAGGSAAGTLVQEFHGEARPRALASLRLDNHWARMVKRIPVGG